MTASVSPLLIETVRGDITTFCADQNEELEPDSWQAQQWGDFIAWLAEGGRDDTVRLVFSQTKDTVFASFDSFSDFRGNYGSGNTHLELYEKEDDFTAELFSRITTPKEAVEFVRFHEWQVIDVAELMAKFAAVNVQPIDWLKVFGDESLSHVQSDDLRLMATHWEASTVTFEDWRYTICELLDSPPTHYSDRSDDDRKDVPHYPEVQLLMEIALRKMREIVQTDNPFLIHKSPSSP